MTADDKMRLVIGLAEEAMNAGEMPIAAMVFDGDQVVARAATSERQDRRLLVHAEIKTLLDLDAKGYSRAQKSRFQLFTNLEPCMMCLGAAISSFIGEVCYSFDAPSDGAAAWALRNWKDYHELSIFALPKISSGILVEECRNQFRHYVDRHKTGPYVDWAKTML